MEDGRQHKPNIVGQIGDLFSPDIIDLSEYHSDISECFNVKTLAFSPVIAVPQATLRTVKKQLRTAPAFISTVKARVPKEVWQAMLTKEQQGQLASGALELMTKKDGSILAKLINPKTKRMVSNIAIEKVKISPNFAQELSNFSSQMRMAEIAEQVQDICIAVEDVRKGLENDRLATAYSCLQKYYQATTIHNKRLKEMALLQIAMDAEDSRNLLMLSQRTNVEMIASQPESLLKKLLSGTSKDEIDTRINEVRTSLNATNLVSLAAAMAYQSLGEQVAAEQSLQYYATFIRELYLNTDGLIDRLDMLDPSPTNYWSKNLPVLVENIQCLPSVNIQLLKEAP